MLTCIECVSFCLIRQIVKFTFCLIGKAFEEKTFDVCLIIESYVLSNRGGA